MDLAEQQDPQEFNKLFVDKIDEINQSKIGIKSHIQGQLMYKTLCLNCKNESIRRESFLELGLSIENCSTLNECILNYFVEEYMNLEDNNGYDCSHCESKQNAVRRVEIDTSPSVLFLQLLRYVYDKETFEKRKLMKSISFPGTISLNDEEYDLVAVLYHKGLSAYGGHYICEVLNWETQSWWLCDDDLISATIPPDSHFKEDTQTKNPIDVDEVISVDSDSKPRKKRKQSHSRDSTSHSSINESGDSLDRSRNAYMLAYVKKTALTNRTVTPPEHARVSNNSYKISHDLTQPMQQAIMEFNENFLRDLRAYQHRESSLRNEVLYLCGRSSTILIILSPDAETNGSDAVDPIQSICQSTRHRPASCGTETLVEVLDHWIVERKQYTDRFTQSGRCTTVLHNRFDTICRTINPTVKQLRSWSDI